ncbi:MAG: HEPN domain-containing protein [Sulfolobales archaeon]
MQALRDLKAAKDSLEDGNYEWSCFQAASRRKSC